MHQKLCTFVLSPKYKTKVKVQKSSKCRCKKKFLLSIKALANKFGSCRLCPLSRQKCIWLNDDKMWLFFLNAGREQQSGATNQSTKPYYVNIALMHPTSVLMNWWSTSWQQNGFLVISPYGQQVIRKVKLQPQHSFSSETFLFDII